MSYFNYNGKQVYYNEAGDGVPLLLLHGNTVSSRMFQSVLPLYTAKYKVVWMDFLGHGASDRLDSFPTDLWYDEARQVIPFLREKQYGKVNIIGTSGGALVAINIALEAPELVNRVIADSFEGECALPGITDSLASDREASKRAAGAVMFYRAMHGEDWERVVDCDTEAVVGHSREIRRFFHKELSELKPEILLTGSREDEFLSLLSPNYFEKVFCDLLRKAGHGRMLLFEHGGHPAMLSNAAAFFAAADDFFGEHTRGTYEGL